MFSPTRFFLFCAFIIIGASAYSQKDTLHIYYMGMQTAILDSNDAKITRWVKSLNGRHVDLEIYTYYDNSDFKKYMNERMENLHMVVNRKARDQISVKFMGPVKGKKSQRSVADVVYTSANPAPATTTAVKTDYPTATEQPKKETTISSATTETRRSEAEKPEKKSEKKEEKVKTSKNDAYEYIMDSTYVNGQLKVTKRKVKKQQ